MAGRRAPVVSRTAGLPQQQFKWPEWALFFLTAILDIVCSTRVGLVPTSGVRLVRFAVMFILYREWALAITCAFFLPVMVPLTAVCFMKRSWVAFRATALAAVDKERARMAAASGPPRPAGVPPPLPQATHGDRATRRGTDRVRPPGETSGYDVSAVSGEEVIELSSWTDPARSSKPGPRARR